MRDAAQAKAALQGMSDAVKATTAAEVQGASQAAAAREKDLSAIRAEAQALTQLEQAAKQTNTQLLYGGRNDMTQHLSDLAKELEYTTLLNRQKWLGFSSVQQAMSYRQQMYQLALLENKAHFAGYLTADQYLGFLQREVAMTSALSAATRDRTAAIAAETSALLSHANALHGTRQTVGQLGEQLGPVASFAAYSALINDLPDSVTTKVELDAGEAMAHLATYRAALLGLPRSETTDVISVGLARDFRPGARQPEIAPRVGMSDIARALDETDALDEMLRMLGRESVHPQVELEGGAEAAADAALLAAELEHLRERAQVHLGADFDDIEAARIASQELDEAIQVLGVRKAEPEVQLRGVYATEEELAALDAEMDVLEGRVIDTVIHVDTHGAIESVQEFVHEAEAELRTARGPAWDRAIGPPQWFGGGKGGGGGGGGPPPGSPGDEAPDPRDGPAWRAVGEELDRVDAMFKNVKRSAAGAGAAARGAAKDAQAFVDPLVASTGGWFGLNSQLRVFGGLLPGAFGTVAAWHVVLDFIIEFLAVFVPAIVTAIAGLTAFGIAGADAGKAVYNRLLAIHTAADATGQSLAPLTGSLEKLHQQVRPMVWEIYGDAIDIARNKTGLFNTLALDTGRTLDRLAARITVDLTRSGSGLETFLTVGREDLAKLGEFFHSIGIALLNFIKITQDTHVDQIFLNLFVALAKLLELVSKLPTPLLAVVVGLHAFWLWGGLAATVALQLLNPLRGLALALGAVDAASVGGGLASLGKDASAFSRLKAGLNDIGAGLSAIPGRIGLFSKSASGAEAATSGLAKGAEGAAASVGGLGAALTGPIGLLVAAVVALAGAAVYLGMLPDQTRKWTTALGQAVDQANAFTVVDKTVSNLAAVTQALALAQKTGAGNATELAASQADLNTRLSEEISHVGEISKLYGTNFVGALDLLNTAGVKTSDIFSKQADTWAYAKQQVKGLVDGYAAMGQGLSALQQDVSAQLVTTSDQVTAMGKLNQAWDQFQGIVAGPVNAFLTLDDSVNTFLSDASASGAAMLGLGKDVLTAAGSAKQAAPSITNSAIQLQQQFQSVYGNVQQLFDAFRTAQAVNGGKGSFTQFVKDAVAALIPLAGTNKAAAAEISQLAQEAGGPGTTSLQQLSKWAGNVKDPMLALYNASEKATQGTADLSQDAQRLTSTLQQDLTPAMSNAIFQAQGGQKPFQDFADALKKGGPAAQDTIAAARKVATELKAVAGNNASAKADFIGFMEAQGLSAKQAQKLWQEANQNFQGSLAATRASLAKTVTSVQQLGSPGLWGQIEHQYMAKFDQMAVFFTKTLPHAYDLSNHYLAVGWGAVFVGFQHDVADKIYDFFTGSSGKDLKGFISNSLKLFDGYWSTIAHYFGQYVVSDVAKFFTVTLPGFISNSLKLFDGYWSNVAHYFGQYVVADVAHFFTSLIPGWFGEIAHGWDRLWSDAWSGFSRHILQPVENFFTVSLPNTMIHGVKSGIDSVIGGMNTVIGFINDVTGVVGVHIGSIPKLAHGGSVPGTGDEDGTHIVAMPGEWMLRKPARMALQAAYGPDFLPYLNQADTWLGAGSRGNSASQRPSGYGRYAAGGALGGIEDWLGSVGGDLESLAEAGWLGITGAAADVAKWGEKAVFDVMWNTTARPFMAGLEKDGTPGAMAASWLTSVHGGVENWINGKTSAASSQASSAGPGGGVPAANAALARRLMPSWGSGTEWVSWNDLEMREAGWNQFATNPTSGAYGIPQALPPTKMPFAAQRAGGSNPAAQIEWMISYITSVYGDPIAADIHERTNHWYAAGGPVTSAVRGVTPNREQREAMALGSYLLTRWDTSAHDRKRDEYGAWLIDLKDHKGFSAKQARNAYDSAKLLAPYYDKAVKGSTPAYWRVHPELAALHAYEAASTAAGTHWSTPSTGLLNEAWSLTRAAFPLPPEKMTRSISGKDVAEWSKDAARMWPAWEDALKQWRVLENTKRPTGKHAPTGWQWAQWLDWRGKIADQEKEAGKVIAPLFAGLHDPAVLRASMFTGAERAVEHWAAYLPQAQLPGALHPGVLSRAEADLHRLENYIGGAGHAWQGLYGQYVVPGVQVRPPGQPPITVDLNKLITGFPFGEGGSGAGDYGFAAGGSVPQLSDVAGMFSGGMAGMAAGGVVPSLFVPGLSATLTKQLSAASAGQLPRTLADGAASKTGLHVDNLTINNPRPEKPSDSITRASNRLAFLGGRGMV